MSIHGQIHRAGQVRQPQNDVGELDVILSEAKDLRLANKKILRSQRALTQDDIYQNYCECT